jgi:transcriptional regulator with XRE-family HTH domain
MLRVKFERLRRAWSQTVLAFRTGMSAAEISRIETGRTRPYPGQLLRLAAVLEVDPQALVEEVPCDAGQGRQRVGDLPRRPRAGGRTNGAMKMSGGERAEGA